ncbi:hypothetical protein HDU91_001812 [Kappamyces sp. JEL0680]|nr:hypothetical protein HDU91_001812 [Kappamyces sp. JEL0680]
MMPLLFGLVPALDYYVHGFTALFGSLFGLLALVLYAILNQYLNVEGSWNGWSTIANGLQGTFYLVYDWPSFTVGLCFSVAGVFLYVLVEEIYYRVKGKPRPTPAHLLTSPYDDEKKPAMVDSQPSTATLEQGPVIAAVPERD